MKKCIVQYWIPSSQYSDPEYNNLLQEKDQYSLAAVSYTHLTLPTKRIV